MNRKPSEDLLARNGYINYEECGKCGGYCCKNSPCGFLPGDFIDVGTRNRDRGGIMARRIAQKLISREAILSQAPVVGGGKVLFARMRGIKDDPKAIFTKDDLTKIRTKESLGNRCIALGKDRCQAEPKPSVGAIARPGKTREECSMGVDTSILKNICGWTKEDLDWSTTKNQEAVRQAMELAKLSTSVKSQI